MMSMHKNAQNQNLHDANCPCDGQSSRPHSQLIPAIRDAQCPIHNPEVAVIEVYEEQGSHTAGNCSEYRTDRVRSNQYRSCDTCRRGHSNRTRYLAYTELYRCRCSSAHCYGCSIIAGISGGCTACGICRTVA